MSTELRQLSERELEILRLVAAGLSNQQIANQLGVSINTVKVHLRNVFGKIGAASRTEATLYAVRMGIVTVDRVAIPVQDVPAIEVPSMIEHPPVEEQRSLPSVIDQVDEQVEPGAVAATPLIDDGTRLAELQPVPALPIAEPVRRRRVAWLPALLGLGTLLALMLVGAWAGGWLDPSTTATPLTGQPTGDEPERWKVLADAPTARAAAAVVSIGNQMYLIGGENQSGVLGLVQRYDPRFGTWTELSPKPTPATDVRAAVVGGKIYVPGGRLSNDPKDVTRVFERYDPRTERWEQLPDLPAPRSAYALAALEGTIYLFGGWDGTSYRAEVFAFDPDSNRWREGTAMPTARAFADAAVVEGQIYVLGGENQAGRRTSNELYSPAEEGGRAWTVRAPMPHPRSKFGTIVALSSLIHVVGGIPGDSPPLKYNVDTDNWEAFKAAPQAIGSQPGVALLGGTIVIVGGRSEDGMYTSGVQTYQALYSVFAPQQ